VIQTETPVAPANNENGASRAQEPVPSKAQEHIAGEFTKSLEPGAMPVHPTDHGAILERALALPVVAEIARMKEWTHAEAETRGRALVDQIARQVGALR